MGVAYFLMSEANVRREMSLPWVSFGSDEEGEAPEGVFLLSAAHPRAYGNFARVFAKYVREDHALSTEQAVRRLTTLPANNLSLKDRGRLGPGAFADVVVFDPNTIQDHATYEDSHRLSTGVSFVIVNGKLALDDGNATGAATGRVIRGRAWTGHRAVDAANQPAIGPGPIRLFPKHARDAGPNSLGNLGSSSQSCRNSTAKCRWPS